MIKPKKIIGHDPDRLAGKLQIYVDRRGNIIEKDSTPVTSTLTMDLTEGDISIYFYVGVSAMGNGSHRTGVSYKGKEVLDMRGNYTSGPFNTKVTLFKNGKWLNLLEKRLVRVH